MNKGYTTIELLMVMVIIGFFAAIVLPAFATSYDTLKIEGACRQLMRDIRYVQQLSTAHQAAHGVSFSESGDSYWLYRLDISGVPMFVPIKDPATQKPSSVTYATGKFSAVRFSTQFQPVPYPNRLEFNTIGAPLQGGSVTLNYSGITRTITIEANTGMLQLGSGDGGPPDGGPPDGGPPDGGPPPMP